jgi:hypothetical protein
MRSNPDKSIGVEKVSKICIYIALLFALFQAGSFSLWVLSNLLDEKLETENFVADEVLGKETTLRILSGEKYEDIIFKIIENGDTLKVKAILENKGVSYFEGDNGKTYFPKNTWKRE